MTWPLIRFVAEPTTGATVRLDLSVDGAAWVGAEGYSFGAPTFEGGPGSVGAEYGYRRLSMTVHLQGTKTAALTTLSSLATEIQRSQNWLLFQLQSGSVPVWFRTYRTQPGELSLDAVYDESSGSIIPDRWDIEVHLDAEPFAYGAREAMTLASPTISNDPASGTNRMAMVLPAVKGDAPAELRVGLDPSLSNMAGYKFMLSSVALETGASYTAPYFWQVGTGDSFTADTDTGAGVADATTSNGSYRSVSFATDATLIKRMHGTMPSMPAGLYKVLGRFRRSDTSSTFSARLGQTVGGIDVPGLTTAVLDRATSFAAHATWLDLGEFTFPHGGQAPSDFIAADGAPTVFLQASRLSGTGALHVDAFAAIPVSGEDVVLTKTLFSEFDAIGPTGSELVLWDTAENMCWVAAPGPPLQPITAAKPILTGGFPVALPGHVNVLHVFQQVNGQKPFGGTDSSDSITATTTLSVSYHPRYLWLAAA
jgi:hypothetical protein